MSLPPLAGDIMWRATQDKCKTLCQTQYQFHCTKKPAPVSIPQERSQVKKKEKTRARNRKKTRPRYDAPKCILTDPSRLTARRIKQCTTPHRSMLLGPKPSPAPLPKIKKNDQARNLPSRHLSSRPCEWPRPPPWPTTTGTTPARPCTVSRPCRWACCPTCRRVPRRAAV